MTNAARVEEAEGERAGAAIGGAADEQATEGARSAASERLASADEPWHDALEAARDPHLDDLDTRPIAAIGGLVWFAVVVRGRARRRRTRRVA